jgi:hypothetical protein
MAATISSGIDDHGNHYLTLDGPIVPGDPERFAAEIFAANAHGYRLDALRLNSPGGSVCAKSTQYSGFDHWQGCLGRSEASSCRGNA